MNLKAQLLDSSEPFVWETLPEHLIGEKFPTGVRSAWIFVLRARHHISSHHHPSSIQHTAVIEGDGWAKIGNQRIELQVFNPNGVQPIWYVVGKSVPPEFVTGDFPVVVISFYARNAHNLVEVETESGSKRIYERRVHIKI